MTNQVQAVQRHTPGPWTELEDTPDASVVFGPESQPLASIYVAHHGAAGKANARLIAAAPELLEAAMAALDYYAQNENDDAPTAIELRAAIAKAII